jgi:xanthine/CO dehydrogenase XdhC/CoxF family maturation factor
VTEHEHEHGHPHPHGHDGVDLACAIAHGDAPPPVGDRRLIAVFDSPVARELAHFAAHVGYEVVVLEPRGPSDGSAYVVVRDAAAAGLDDRADVVVTDHDRPELGDVLADVLRGTTRWIGVMGSPRHTGPHIQLLRERGFSDEDIGRVHRPIGLNIGSRSPAEIAIATLAGLLADRNGRSGGAY